MNSKAFPRFIGQVLSLVLCAVLLAGPAAHAAVAPDSSRSATAPARLAALSGPVPDFAAAPTSGLAPLDVAFTNTSAGTYTSCLWESGDGKSTTKDNPSHRYQKSGVYTVTLTVAGPGAALAHLANGAAIQTDRPGRPAGTPGPTSRRGARTSPR